MSSLLSVEKEPSVLDSKGMTVAEIAQKILAAGIGARDVLALVDPDDAELRFAVVDDRVPGGGYVDAFPLMTGRSYLLVPLDVHPADAERGINIPAKD